MAYKVGVVAIAALSTVFVLTTPTRAQDKKTIDLTFKCSIVNQQDKQLVSPEDSIFAAVAKCAVKLPGDPIDGADGIMSETVVLGKKGVDHGIISFANDKGSITTAFWGDATTAMVGGQPHTATSGNFKMTVGTGIYAGGASTGTYTASFTTKTEIAGEFKGTLTMPKPADH